MRILLLTHGAGSNRNAPLLVAVANAFQGANIEALRCDLSFRLERSHGPPRPGDAARDREELRKQILKIREKNPERVWLGGHSYGSRQSSILAAESPELVDGLLLLSYPLHPPRKPAELRTAHFPNLRTPALFVHGSRDPFATTEELRNAMALIPGHVNLLEIEGAWHDLGKDHASVASNIVSAFLRDPALART